MKIYRRNQRSVLSMAMNLTQKLFAAHLAEPAELVPGQEIKVTVDQTLTHDINAVMAYLAFEALDLDRVRTKLSVSYIDHNLLQIDNKTPDDHIYLQSIAQKYGLVLSKAGNGICHALQCSRFGKPGTLLLGGDSHTPSCGALGMLAIGVGGMDIAVALAGFPYVMKMPKVVKVNLKGRLRPGTAAKDIILEMLRRTTVKGGVGKVYEYVGEGVETLSIPERLTIANMGAEMGATTSVFPADGQVRAFLKAQGREQDYTEWLPDAGCGYDEEIQLDLDALEPLVACPHMPDNVMKVADVPKIPVQQVFIGSCTNGSYSDFKKVALVLKEHKINPDVSLVLGISSRQIYLRLLQDGVIADLVDSGARITEFACGPCCGIGIAPSSKGISVRTSNRNFKGRSGGGHGHQGAAGPAPGSDGRCKRAGYSEGTGNLSHQRQPVPAAAGRRPGHFHRPGPQHQTPAGSRSAGRNPGSQGQPEGPGQRIHRRHYPGQRPVLLHAEQYAGHGPVRLLPV